MPRLKIRKFKGLNLNQSVPDDPAYVRKSKNIRMLSGEAHVREGWPALHNANASTAFRIRLSDFRNAAGTLYHVAKHTTKLITFSTTDPTAAVTDVIAGMDSATTPDFANGNGYLFVADSEVKNYITTGVSGNTALELHSVTASTALSPTETGAVTGFGTGIFKVCYSFYNPGLDMETPPRAVESITKASVDVGIRVTTPADPGSGYTTMRFYRTRTNESKLFYDGSSTTFASTYSFTNLDTTLDSASFPASELHNEFGAIVAEKPVAFEYCEWHKGRMFGATTGVRVRWSDVNRPTQWRTANVGQTPAYYHDLNAGAGRKIMGMNSFDGSLTLFKDYSITVKNGDVDPSSFQWFVAVDGICCAAPWSRAVAPGIGIFFVGYQGVYVFDNRTATLVSDFADGSGIGDYLRGLSTIASWVGVWNEQMREYWLAVDELGSGWLTSIFAYNPDKSRWSGPFFMGGNLGTGLGERPTALGVLEVSEGPRVCVATTNATATGNTFKTGTAAKVDANYASGVASGTVTSVTGNHLNDTGAAFFTTGDGLIGKYVTVRHSASSYETKRITANSATRLEVGDAWSAAPTGKSYFVGGIDATLSFCRFDGEDSGYKEMQRIGGIWEKQTHTKPVRCGWTKDDDTEPTYIGDEQTMGDVRFSVPCTDRAVSISPYFNILAHNSAFELRGVDLDFDLFEDRGPAS